MTSIYLTDNEWYQIPSVTNVDMAGNKIENLAAPAAPLDAVNKQYADSLAGGINPSQWSMFPAVANVNMNISTITNLKPPVNIGDAANKGYCDSTASAAASAASALWASSPASQNVLMNTSSILNVGSLGIGTAAPSAKVEIVQDAAADCLRVLDSNADTTYFKIDQDGNVGIKTGAATLSDALSVAGNVTCSIAGAGSGWFKGVNIGWYVANGGTAPLITPSAHLAGLHVRRDNGNLIDTQIWTAEGVDSGTMRMHIQNTTGNVGVGTSTPTAKLEIVQNAASDCVRVLDSNADTTYFKIDQDGNVGIKTGATALTAPLTVVGSGMFGSGSGDTTSQIMINTDDSADKLLLTKYGATSGRIGYTSGNTMTFTAGNPAFSNSGTFVFNSLDNTTYVERMRLDNTGNLGIGTNAPAAKLHIVQDTANDAMRVLDSNADTTYFKIDSNGYVGANCGASALTKALCIGYGASDTGSNASALKFNSADGDKIFLTYLDNGSRISQLALWGVRFDAGIDNGAANNQGFFSWRTGATAAFVERMRLENNGQLNVMSNKIINVATPTATTDAANKSYVDSVAATGSAGWSLNPALSTINASSYKIVNLGNPVNSGDAVNKAYLDSNYFNPKGGNCHYVEASIDSPGTDYTVNLANSPFNDIFVNICLKAGYTKNIYWTNNNNTNLQGRRVHVSVSGTSDAGASGKCYYLNGSGSYYDISLNSSNRVLVFTFLMGYTGLNDWVLESSRPN